MLAASLAFGWLAWRQHRIGLVTMLGLLFVAAVVSALLPGYCSRDTAGIVFSSMFAVFLPLFAVMFLGLFTYAREGVDVLARESCFPPRFFRLPVSTRALVAWPCFCGAAAAMLLWWFAAWFLVRPWLAAFQENIVRLPLVWPAFFLAAVLAWMQALLWLPFGVRYGRAVLIAMLVVGLGPLLVVSLTWTERAMEESHFALAEIQLSAVYLLLLWAGWTLSYIGVTRARRGEVPSWDALTWPLREIASWRPRRATPFASPEQSQAWLEWRLTGLTLPIMTALALPTVLWFLALGENDVLPPATTLVLALLLPVYLAGFAESRGLKDSWSMSALLAALPLTTSQMVGAKLRAAAWSTLATWLMMAAVLSLAVVLTGNLDDVTWWWRFAREERSPVQVVAGLIAAAMVFLVWTWKRQVDSQYIGLTGREWLAVNLFMAAMFGFAGLWVLAGWILLHPNQHRGAGLSGRPVLASLFYIASFFGSIGVGILALWIYNTPALHEPVLAVLPWLLGVFTLCRITAALWALRAILRQRLVEPRTVLRWLAAWLLLAAALCVVLAWAVPPDRVPTYYLVFAVLFAMPMARLASAPLALAWNRHR